MEVPAASQGDIVLAARKDDSYLALYHHATDNLASMLFGVIRACLEVDEAEMAM